MIDFKNKPMISKYMKILNITQEELGRGIIAEDTIKLLEKGKRKLTIPTASILVSNFNNIAEEKGILLNLSIKDLMVSEKEYVYEKCIEELKVIDINEFKIDRYLEILEAGEKFQLPNIIDTVTYIIGENLYKQKKCEEAIEYLKQSLNIKKKLDNVKEIPKVLNRIGAAYFYLEKYDNAFSYISESYNQIKIQNISDNKLKEIVLFNLALSLARIGEGKYQLALEYIDELINFMDHEQESFIDAMIVKGNILDNLGHSDYAIKVYEEVLPRAEDKSLLYYNLSVTYSNMGNDEKSLECAYKLIEIKSVNIDEYTSKALIRLGNLYKRENLYKEAILMYSKAINVGKKFYKLEQIVECYEKIFECYDKDKKFKFFDEYLEGLFIDLDLFLQDSKLVNRILIIIVQYLNKYNNLTIIDEIFCKLKGE